MKKWGMWLNKFFLAPMVGIEKTFAPDENWKS